MTGKDFNEQMAAQHMRIAVQLSATLVIVIGLMTLIGWLISYSGGTIGGT